MNRSRPKTLVDVELWVWIALGAAGGLVVVIVGWKLLTVLS